MRHDEVVDGETILREGLRLDEREHVYVGGVGAPVEEGERVFRGRLKAVERELRRRLAADPPGAEPVREERRPRRSRFADSMADFGIDGAAVVEEFVAEDAPRRGRSRRRPGAAREFFSGDDLGALAEEAAGEVARTSGRKAPR